MISVSQTAKWFLVGSVLATGSAMAGSKFTGNGSVRITQNVDGSGVAVAYLGMVYNGSGLTEYLGCQKSGTDQVFCHARTETGTHVACFTTSSHLAQSVSSISPDARVTFRWNAGGACTQIAVQHSSEYADKQG